MSKTYNNTKKGRNSIPKKPGAYNLLDKNGKKKYTGHTNDLNRRIKEHHQDSQKHFSKVSTTETRSKQQANRIEDKRLAQSKPKYNKTRK